MRVMLDLHSMSADPNPKAILRVEEVLRRTGLKRTMLYELIKKERFPNQVSLGARAVGWYEDEVEDWIRNRHTAEREPKRLPQSSSVIRETRPSSKTSPVEKAMASSLTPDRQKEEKKGEAISPIVRNRGGSDRTLQPAIKDAAKVATAMSETAELKLLRDENTRLKRLIADLLLKNDLLQSAAQGNAVAS